MLLSPAATSPFLLLISYWLACPVECVIQRQSLLYKREFVLLLFRLRSSHSQQQHQHSSHVVSWSKGSSANEKAKMHHSNAREEMARDGGGQGLVGLCYVTQCRT